jgi:transcription antitermination factor NusG
MCACARAHVQGMAVFLCSCVTLKENKELDGTRVGTREHGHEGGMMGAESLDMRACDGVTVTAIAPGAGHPECGSIPDSQGLIRGSNDVRRGPGRRWHKPASVAVLAPGWAGPRWYMVETHPRQEEAAVAAIQDAGFDAVWPQFRDVVPADARRKMPAREVMRAAFPGYVMAEFDQAADATWRWIATRRGVRRIVGGHAERPTPIAMTEAAWVISQFGFGGVQRQAPVELPPVAPLAVGAPVVVTAGPYAGSQGSVIASTGRSVTLLVGGWRVTMARAAVEIAGPPQS